MNDEIVQRRSKRDFLSIFNACKQIKAKTGRDFKEEYLLIKKRSRTMGRTESNQNTLHRLNTKDLKLI